MSRKNRYPCRNKGWFRRGDDPRRHQLTQEQRKLGGAITTWLYIHVSWEGIWPRDMKKIARAHLELTRKEQEKR